MQRMTFAEAVKFYGEQNAALDMASVHPGMDVVRLRWTIKRHVHLTDGTPVVASEEAKDRMIASGEALQVVTLKLRGEALGGMQFINGTSVYEYTTVGATVEDANSSMMSTLMENSQKDWELWAKQ